MILTTFYIDSPIYFIVIDLTHSLNCVWIQRYYVYVSYIAELMWRIFINFTHIQNPSLSNFNPLIDPILIKNMQEPLWTIRLYIAIKLLKYYRWYLLYHQIGHNLYNNILNLFFNQKGYNYRLFKPKQISLWFPEISIHHPYMIWIIENLNYEFETQF